MIELLKNFEEEVSADQPLQEEEEGDDEDLAKRLGSVNLGSPPLYPCCIHSKAND